MYSFKLHVGIMSDWSMGYQSCNTGNFKSCGNL